jgi:hypothetical protein
MDVVSYGFRKRLGGADGSARAAARRFLDSRRRRWTAFASALASAVAADSSVAAALFAMNIPALAQARNVAKDPALSELRAAYRSIVESPETGLGWNAGGRGRPTDTTRIFEEFIKGITYSVSEFDPTNPTPMYHRLFSCGPGDDAFSKVYRQCRAQPLAARAEAARRIQTCYTERLIYDALWRHTQVRSASDADPAASHEPLPSQRLFRIELTRADFQTCFPNTDLSVNLTMTPEGFPTSVSIARTTRGRLVSVERYTKHLQLPMDLTSYDEIVVAERKTARGTYFAPQAFYVPRPAEWGFPIARNQGFTDSDRADPHSALPIPAM